MYLIMLRIKVIDILVHLNFYTIFRDENFYKLFCLNRHLNTLSAVGVMKPGHAFTIEPMISQGVWTDQTWPDNWTSVTQDGKLSAQFEQTMVVTDKGVEILTARKGEKSHIPYFMDSLK